MTYFFKLLQKFFGTSHTTQVFALTLSNQFLCAQTIIRAFYSIVSLSCFSSIESWSSYFGKTGFDPLWPVYWLRYVDTYSGITFILWFYFINGLLALTANRWRVARILVFLALLEFIAFQNSFGKINHDSHISLLLSFVLIFLPSGWHSFNNLSKYVQAATLIVFSGCQVLMMLTYTMAGFYKVLYIPIQIMRHQVHALMPEALALQIANRLLQTDTPSQLGPWLIEHYYLGWPLMIGTIYLQFFSVWVAFRPSLHQLWGFNLILFHIASELTMTISFWMNCTWLAFFFLNSPFKLKNIDWRKTTRDLPLIGLFFPIFGIK